MSSDTLSRRRFMQGSGALVGSSLLRLSVPAALAAAQDAAAIDIMLDGLHNAL